MSPKDLDTFKVPYYILHLSYYSPDSLIFQSISFMSSNSFATY